MENKTLNDVFLEALEAHGLWPKEAEEVMSMAKKDPENIEMLERWDNPARDYPAQLYQTVWINISDHAVQYIDANKPNHIARNLLVGRF